jgi:catechol 2,3-dioxygenase
MHSATTERLPFAATTPVSVSRVGLKARDENGLADYYKHLLGLRETRRSGRVIGLGTGERELLEIEGADTLKPDDPRAAGLFHTAFLLPTRADLARWARRATDEGIAVTGASDHLVSEAIYLTDPEGNGIEIYADRAPETWRRTDGEIAMATERLDFASLLSVLEEGDSGWAGAPDGTIVGHVHLRAGDVGEAEQWWAGEVGLETMAHYGDAAVFMSSGGYHHHVGNNVWRSRGAGRRDADRSGLAFVELFDRKAAADRELTDPWGSEIRLVLAA